MGYGDLHAGILLCGSAAGGDTARGAALPTSPMPPSSIFSRETRLLLTTLVVSVGVLLLLARYRFPQQDTGPAQSIVPRPLDRWTATSSYDELAAAIDDARLRVSPSLEVFRLSGTAAQGDTLAAAPSTFVPALRIRSDVAMAFLPQGARIVGLSGAEGVPALLARDRDLGLAVVRVPEKAAGATTNDAGVLPLAPIYLAEAFGTPSGAALRPIFVGRTDVVLDPRWSVSLVGLHPSPEFGAGKLLFTMNGRLAGITVAVETGVALVPASAALAQAEALLEGQQADRGDLGVAVQALTPQLSRALGATSGVAVRDVDANGPAKGHARPGDVVEAVDDTRVYSPEAFERHVAAVAPGTSVVLHVKRFGTAVQIPLVVTTAAPTEASTLPLGLSLRPAASGGSEVVAVHDASVGQLAGLRAGDLITQVGSAINPRPADIESAFERLDTGASVVLGVSRHGKHALITLDKP